MESLSFILLMPFLTRCHGAAHFHYLKKGEEVILCCETCQWKADVDSDNKVDCTNSKSTNYLNKPECPAAKPDLCQEIKGSTSNNQIRVKRGSFACLSNFTSDDCFLHPFKPSAHHVESFIVAQEEPDMVSEPSMENSVNVSAGGSINLTCIFTPKGNYSSKPFVVYWIKTDADSSTCVYSYHFSSLDDAEFDDHCAIEKDLLLRRSHTSHPSPTDTNTHNLTISNATHSDSGQYLCVLRVDVGDKQHWTIITNTTATAGDPDSVKHDKPNASGIKTGGMSNHCPPISTGSNSAGIICATAGAVVLVFIVIIIVLMRRSAGTKASQTVITQSFQNRSGEDDDDECSPYAVSQRETEPMYSLVQLPSQNSYSMKSSDGEPAAEPALNPSVLMKKNSIYDPSGK